MALDFETIVIKAIPFYVSMLCKVVNGSLRALCMCTKCIVLILKQVINKITHSSLNLFENKIANKSKNHWLDKTWPSVYLFGVAEDFTLMLFVCFRFLFVFFVLFFLCLFKIKTVVPSKTVKHEFSLILMLCWSIK